MRTGFAPVPRPSGCVLRVEPLNLARTAEAMQAGGLIGVLVIDHYPGQLDERVMDRIRAKACPAGAVSISLTNITVNPMNGVQNANVSVLGPMDVLVTPPPLPAAPERRDSAPTPAEEPRLDVSVRRRPTSR